MFKILAGLIIVLALVIGIVPQFTDCQSHGKAIALANGTTVPMKCHWTGQAALGMAVPLLGLGSVTAFSKRKESRRIIAVLGTTLGAIVILLPTRLIGVCANPMMECNSIMKPTLILSGALVIGLSVVGLVISERKAEQIG
jgi:hypothetical protein